MTKRNTSIAVSFIIAAVVCCLASASAAEFQPVQASASTCDRKCLSGFVTKYLDALVAHKPGDVPVAPNARFTEDCKEMKLGEGLWAGISRLRDYRRDIMDVRDQTAVSFLVAEEGSSPVLFVLRLKIANNKISEIETTAVRGQKEGRNAFQRPEPSERKQNDGFHAG
jgi:hypothetical protein